jgi:uncharacterized membrane protein YhhN
MSYVAHPVEKADRPRFGPAVLALVAISLVAGFAYPFVEGRFGPIAEIVMKGTAVGVLAIAAGITRGEGAKWLAAILAAGALGDMLLELPGAFTVGAGAFAVGHVIAILFYRRYRRSRLWTLDGVYAAALIGYGLVLPSLLLPASEPTLAPTLYGGLLGAMAGAAWISGFARRWVALGALLFVISDTLLLMRMGGLLINGDAGHGRLVWFSYYFAQLAIFIGVLTGLGRGIAPRR